MDALPRFPVDGNGAMWGERINGKQREPLPPRSYAVLLQLEKGQKHIRKGFHRIPYEGEIKFQGCRIVGWKGRNYKGAGDIVNRREPRNPIKPDGLEKVGVGTTGMEETIGAFPIPGDTAYPLQLRAERPPKNEAGEIRNMKSILRLKGESIDRKSQSTEVQFLLPRRYRQDENHYITL